MLRRAENLRRAGVLSCIIDHLGNPAPGKVADLVLFDPATIQDVATFEEPHQYAAGIRWVIVAGEVVIDHGEHTGNMCGKVLTCVR